MKRLLLALCALLAGCSTVEKDSAPEGTLVVSIELTQGALSGRPKGKTGWFFYVEETPGIAGPRLSAWNYDDDRVIDSLRGSSDSASVVEAIAAIGLEPFDFEQEVRAVNLKLQAEEAKGGPRFRGPLAMDGAEYEITIMTGKGRFQLREWNPGYTIDAYAPYSVPITKLKLVIDTLAQYYGRTKIGI